MPFSIKQKQVLGVTTIVVIVVIGLSVLQIGTLVRVLLEQGAARAELVAASVIHQTGGAVASRETAYQDIRSSPMVRSALETAIYSPEVLYAAIVDRTRTVVAANDPAQVGRTLKVFDWTGVSPTGAFAVSSPYHWDLSRLYSTGEITLAAVPEPSTVVLLAMAAGIGIGRRRNIHVVSKLIPA